MTQLNQTVQDATDLAVSFERVDKLPSPLLVIGLGGTGCDILRTVKRTFAERFNLPLDDAKNVIPVPERTAYLAIDTDANSLRDFETGECPKITNTSIVAILKDHEHLMTAQERTWVHAGLTSISPGAGAGTYRSAARLMLSRNYDEVRNGISAALRRIATVAANNAVQLGRVEIVIIAGIGGGTGSGTFLDIPQIVRHIMETDATLSGKLYKITGYLVMPDVTLSHVQNESMAARIRANGYAALKELDFWMGYETHRTHYTMTYGTDTQIEWVRPYDYCTLICGTNIHGVAFADPYQVAQNTVAENLLHYLASETPSGETAQFSYISYENNLDAMVANLPKNMPLNYLYRAIGAYAMAVPKKKLIFYEGSLLFETFMPPRDKRDNLVPNDDLLKDGKTLQRVSDMTGNIGNLYNQFAADNPYPAVFNNLDPKNTNTMENLRQMQPVPHEYYSQPPQWDQTVLEPAARKAAEGYLKLTWDNFQKFCSYVLADPEKGPFSLLLYLTDEGEMAFMPALRKVEQEWENYANNLRNDVGPRSEACVNTFNAFLRPPLLGGSKAVRNYLDNLQALLNAVRLNCFMREYNSAMKLFVQRVQAYVETSLKPLCKALEGLSKELVSGVVTADHQHGDLFNIDIVKGTIDATFTTQNQNNNVSRGFLERLCQKTLETLDTPDGCGVMFPFAQEARRHIMVTMRDELNAHLGNVNGQSLDTIMEQAGNTDVQSQNMYIDDLGNRVLNSASPLFSQNAGFPGVGQAEYSYFSIPNDAPMHVQRLKQTLSIRNVQIKESTLRDHIYCTTAWDGLPLFRYSLMEKLEEAYEATIKTENSAGTHLVWDGSTESPYTSNWTKLPSPNPFYVFQPKGGSARAKKEYEDAHKIVDRAVDAGLLTIDSTLEVPSYTFRTFYTDQTHRTLVHHTIIQAQVNELLTGIDPNTGGKRSGAALRQGLNALMAQAVEQKVEPKKSPKFMANMLGIQDQPLNPFAPEAQANPQLHKLAEKNHVALCHEYAVVILLQQPELYERVCEQLPAFESIAVHLHSLDKMSNAWQPRIKFAETFAEMYSFGLLTQNMIGGFTYTDPTGQTQVVIKPAMLSEELASHRMLVKTVSYLADLPDTNETVLHLMARMNHCRQNWNELGKLTMDQMTADQKAVIENRAKNLQKLVEKVDEELKAYQAQRMNDLNADIECLNNCIALLGKMKAYATNALSELGL